MPGWVGLYRGTYFIVGICSWKWMLGETYTKERGQICCLFQKSLKLQWVKVIYSLHWRNSLESLQWTDKERMKQIDFFHDIREEPRKRVLEILVNENWKPNPWPLLHLYRTKNPQWWLCKESHSPGPAKEPSQSLPTAPAISYPVPGKGQSTQQVLYPMEMMQATCGKYSICREEGAVRQPQSLWACKKPWRHGKNHLAR